MISINLNGEYPKWFEKKYSRYFNIKPYYQALFDEMKSYYQSLSDVENPNKIQAFETLKYNYLTSGDKTPENLSFRYLIHQIGYSLLSRFKSGYKLNEEDFKLKPLFSLSYQINGDHLIKSYSVDGSVLTQTPKDSNTFLKASLDLMSKKITTPFDMVEDIESSIKELMVKSFMDIQIISNLFDYFNSDNFNKFSEKYNNFLDQIERDLSILYMREFSDMLKDVKDESWKPFEFKE